MNELPTFPLRITAAKLDPQILKQAAIHVCGEERNDDSPRSIRLAMLIGHHATQEHWRRKSLETDSPRDLKCIDIGVALCWPHREFADALECSDQLARSPAGIHEAEYFTAIHTGLVYIAAERLRSISAK